MNDSERIAVLRERCFERKVKGRIEVPYIRYKILRGRIEEIKAFSSEQLRKGRIEKLILSNARMDIDELEVMAGRIRIEYPRENELPDIEAFMNNAVGHFPGQTGHCELDLEGLFRSGIKGIRDRIEKLRDNPADKKAAEAYNSFIDSLDGLSAFITNAVKTVSESMGSAESVERKQELELIRESCERISEAPPESFRDAIQLMWFVLVAIPLSQDIGLISPGRIDQSLYPFYEKDIRKGLLTDEMALLLIEQLYLFINEFIQDGLAVAVMAGGKNDKGKDMSNRLSFLSFEALRRTNLCYPTVGLAWSDKTPEPLTKLAVELVSKGYATPAFFGDEVIQKGLRHYGVPEPDLWRYINSTCVEITPVGGSGVWVASPYFNLCGFLNEEIRACASGTNEPESFEAFLDSCKRAVSLKIREAVEEQNKNRKIRREKGRKPLQSVFTKDCISKGRDIDDGGARYNWVECSFVGLANLADSLVVLKNEVFEKKNITLSEMNKLLENGFDGAENLRMKFLSYPKYGNSNSEADEFVGMIAEYAEKECSKYKMEPDDSHFVPGAFCWIMHERFGRECGATPDGRKSGMPFADGGGPAQGREKSGPTSSVISTVSWDHSKFIGGIALNMKFSKNLVNNDNGRANLKNLITTYLKNGGFELQINVLDNKVLKKAEADPDQYRDLVVRIGGYTDYFTRLSSEMRKEVMLRTEFSSF